MPRRATGQVVVDDRRTSPIYALRFTANGRRQYVTLGSARDGWTQAKAQDQLERELAAVRLGTWKAPEPEPAPVTETDPTFHDFASDLFDSYRVELRQTTQLDYEWQLSDHLLPFFKGHRLSQITIAEVDRYRAAKVKQGRRRLLAPAWRVTIAGHDVPPRWRVERQTVKLCAVDATAARVTATRAAQIVAQVPPVRSLRAITYRHTTATPLGVTVR